MTKAIQGLTFEAGDAPKIYIYDEIGPAYWGLIDAASVIEALTTIGSAESIAVHINSPGGDVFEAAAIYNALQRHPSNIEIQIDGVAASAASVIAMAGDQITIAGNALMMIHNAWTITWGNAEELARTIETLNKVDQTIIASYDDRTGDKSTREQIVDWMAAETWMDAAEAVERGFADVAGDLKKGIEAAVPAGRYRNTPQQIVTKATPRQRRAETEVSVKDPNPRGSRFPAIAARLKAARKIASGEDSK